MNKLFYILKKVLIKINNASSFVHNKGRLSNQESVINSYVSGEVNCSYVKQIEDSTMSGTIDLGKNIEIKDSIIVGNVVIGNNSMMKRVSINGEKIKIGNYTSLWGPNIFISQNKNSISIGNFCSIAKNVSIQEYNHNSKKISTYFIGQNIFNENWENEKISKGEIKILNDVWIGEKCTILGGVTIGNGAIIGDGSIVTKNIPDYAIAVGSPAKIIGYRFEESIIEKLQQIKWWNWDVDQIKNNKSLFQNELDIEYLNSLL